MSRTHPRIHLRLDSVSIHYEDRNVLSSISLTVSAGERLALIGENGSGKSTLLGIAAGERMPDTGTVSALGPGGASRVGFLPQEPAFEAGETVRMALDRSVAPITAAAHRVDWMAAALAEQPGDDAVAGEYADALAEAERVGAWDIDARIDTVLAGLGLGALPRAQHVRELSGGQRARLALALVLVSRPEVLVLDEPTNHLDDSAVGHLTGVLRGWDGPVLFTSHDRRFLDEVATSIADLDPSPRQTLSGEPENAHPGDGLTRFTGTYSAYLRERDAERSRWERRYRDEQAAIAKLRAGLGEQRIVGHDDWKPRTETRAAQKFYADRNARVVARRVNDERSRLDDLLARQVRRPPQPLRFSGPALAGSAEMIPRSAVHGDLDDPWLTVRDAAVPGRLAPTSFTVRPGEQLLVTGANGAGKSTLLRMIAQGNEGSVDSVTLAAGVGVGMLGQELLAWPESVSKSRRTAEEHYAAVVGVDCAEATPLTHFGLLSMGDAARPLAVFSVGQRRRLELATVLAQPPEVLLLDEPTNHFSLTLVTELERAIKGYPGVVVVASHDRWLRERWSGARVHLTSDSPQSIPSRPGKS